jgi:torulene dioxygenase
LFNYNLDLGRYATYRVFRTSAATGQTDILATISGPTVKPAYLHSFFLCPDYVILCIWPCIFGAAGVKILWERKMVDAMRFDSNIQTRWYVVDRKQNRGVVATFLSPAFFRFHTINAWQTDNGDGTVDIMCDIIQYPTDEMIRRAYYESMVSTGSDVEKYFGSEASRPSLVRYRLPSMPKDSRVELPTNDAIIPQADILLKIEGEGVGDLPTINPCFASKKTRYVYDVVNQGKSSFFDGIAKVDLETQKVLIWSHDHHTPGEAVFVPDGANAAEDAGYLLSIVLNGGTGTSYLLCLNARDMTEVGRADCAAAVGFGFHGTHYPFRQ